MECEIIAEFRRLPLQKLITLVKDIYSRFKIFPIDIGIKSIIEWICRITYRFEDWKDLINIYINITNFNDLCEILRQKKLNLIYTRYGIYLDCISFRDYDGSEIITICEDPELKQEYKRIVILSLERLTKYVRVKIRLIASKGSKISNYVPEIPELYTQYSIPIYYILHLAGINETMMTWSIVASLMLSREIISDSVLALGILLFNKELIEIENARFFLTDLEIRNITDFIPNIMIREKDRVITLTYDGKNIIRSIRIGSSILKVVYLDYVELLLNGIELRPVRLFIY